METDSPNESAAGNDAGSGAKSPDGSRSKPARRRFSRGAIAFSLVLGALVGVGTFTFGYGKGASYMSSDPQACVNCHVMQDQMDSWQQSSHHHVAVCNDCHLPHNFIGKWVTKADNGFFHSAAFTLGNFKDPIQIKPRNRRVTLSTCVDCHKDFVHSTLPADPDDDVQDCIRCHSDVGHAGK